jgi:hypothetical protein
LTDKREAAIKRGLRAKALLVDATLQEALEALRGDGIESLLTCENGDLIERRAYVRVIDEFRRKLEIFVDNGKIAERELK